MNLNTRTNGIYRSSITNINKKGQGMEALKIKNDEGYEKQIDIVSKITKWRANRISESGSKIDFRKCHLKKTVLGVSSMLCKRYTVYYVLASGMSLFSIIRRAKLEIDSIQIECFPAYYYKCSQQNVIILTSAISFEQ